LIEAKAERVAKNKIEDLRKYLEINFPHDLHRAMFTSVGFWDSKSEESKKLRKLFFDKELENQETEFFNKIESVFYNLNN
jgi:hypothetical protein